MAQYILLMKLTPEGQAKLLDDPESIMRAHAEVQIDEVEGLGMYAVLGAYDVIGIIQAEDNEAAARYSVKLGVRIGAHIETLPAVPMVSLEGNNESFDPWRLEGVELTPPDDIPPASAR